jgi:hypothetical protein
MLLAGDLVSDTPTHNAANYGVPAYPLQYMFRKPVEMTMNYMDYTDDRGMFMFSNGQKIKNGSYFSFRWSESIIRNIIFLIKYIRKTRYLLASFVLISIKKANALLIIYFALDKCACKLPSRERLQPSPFVTI